MSSLVSSPLSSSTSSSSSTSLLKTPDNQPTQKDCSYTHKSLEKNYEQENVVKVLKELRIKI